MIRGIYSWESSLREWKIMHNSMKSNLVRGLLASAFLAPGSMAHAQSDDHSVARQWNEIALESIRNDFARPTVHARNLFHNSAGMWDAWACFESGPTPWLFAEDELAAGDLEAADVDEEPSDTTDEA